MKMESFSMFSKREIPTTTEHKPYLSVIMDWGVRFPHDAYPKGVKGVNRNGIYRCIGKWARTGLSVKPCFERVFGDE